MRLTIDETNRRREKQMAYNQAHNITPQQIKNRLVSALGKQTFTAEYYVEKEEINITSDPVIRNMVGKDLNKAIEYARKQMTAAAANLEFIEAAQWRDELLRLEKKLENAAN